MLSCHGTPYRVQTLFRFPASSFSLSNFFKHLTSLPVVAKLDRCPCVCEKDYMINNEEKPLKLYAFLPSSSHMEISFLNHITNPS
ncbi:hypothetical protein L1987_26214 [Smallanthus sonchifolius]|uniref:Uncharacterized protein n=1 Tax=Smallanthus sonchifolius TaxID=185202 RepID=A0ACB9IA60_9ASTR|nr:hypothetical protein L1987_26214 [Smallanthus sonchifolius]